MRSIENDDIRRKGDMQYDFECSSCGATSEAFAQFEEREMECYCGSAMQRIFPVTQSLHHFEPYFDEGLGVDIHSNRQRKDVMRLLGVIESGDKVRGGRNFDEKAITIDRIPQLRGMTVGDLQRENERRKEQGDNFMVQIENEDGTASNPMRAKDLPSKVEGSKGRMKKELEWDQRVLKAKKNNRIITK